ncbi:MAG: hypothetical protein OXU23_10585 [Candidatus Poribacteria bacterium]|nr:hypothetical protein [Candidatus Poribacteria bacterium]
MKKELSDFIKSPKDFERFCNLFLKKEVSSFVTVYGAEGRDKGIDAEFNGSYKDRKGNERSGRWIFQYKFFDPTKDKKYARKSLIRMMEGTKTKKGELDKANEGKCEHYVLMTNTLLTAGNIGKIEDAKNEKGYTFTLTCWDAEDLITMIDEFPYILNSFRDPHLPVFLAWQDMFRDKIDGKHKLLRYDYDTFGREDKIHEFHDFVQDTDKRLLVMYGSGGIGKTQLAIEFAKTVEQKHHEYEPLFVQIAEDSFENALGDIPPNRKYIFFVDDAHDYLDNLGGIKAILNSQEYKESKVILITRNAFKASLKGIFLSALSDQAIGEIEIPKLLFEETKEFIQVHTRVQDSELLNDLAKIGKDTPLIAVMVIYLFNKGVDLISLTKDELVELAFESYLEDILSRHLSESDKKHRELLNWLSGIAPIDVENEQISDKLSELLEVKLYEINQYRDTLKNYGLLVQYGRKQRVFPGPLSDYILRKACFLSDGTPSSFHTCLLDEFLPLFPINLIKNLARVEVIVGEKSLLDEYIDSLKTQVSKSDNAFREHIIENMECVSYFRPEDAIDIFNIILDNPNTKDFVRVNLGIPFTLTHQHLLEKIAKEAQKTVYTLSGFRKTLKVIRKLILKEHLNLSNYDSPQALLNRMASFHTNKPNVFQMEALDVFDEWKEEDIRPLGLALLSAIDSLLTLDFNEIVSEGGSVKFGWHHLKYTRELIRLRKKAIEIIAHCLKTSQHRDVRTKAIDSISRAINPLESPFRQQMEKVDQEQLQKEQARLFDIIVNRIHVESDFTVLNAIDQCLSGYAENEHIEGYPKKRAAELLAKFREHKNCESYLLYRQFTGKFRAWDISESLEKTREFMKKYIAKYTPVQLSKLMKEYIEHAEEGKEYRSPTDGIWEEKGWNPGSATFLLRAVGELNPKYGINLLNEILAWKIDESHCASGLLSGIRVSDQVLARETTQHLLKQDSIVAKRIVAKSFSWTSENEQYIQHEDLEILDLLSDISDSELRMYVVQRIYMAQIHPNTDGVKIEHVLEILVRLSTDDSPRVMRETIKALSNKKLQLSPENHLEEYKQIMLNCVSLERLDYESERVLNTIFRHDPIWVIEFFEKRITYKEKESDRSKMFKYDAVPYYPHHLFNDVDWDDKNMIAALERVRDWVLTPSYVLRFEAPTLLTSMLSENEPRGGDVKINGAMKRLFEEWIDSEDIKLMQWAAYLMRGFDTDSVFYSLVETVIINSEGNKEVQDSITAAIFSRVHSRSIGEPTPLLVQRIKDLKALQDRTQSQIVVHYAENLIKWTEQDIEKQLQEDEEFLEGEEW